jgi:hypothetical protein
VKTTLVLALCAALAAGCSGGEEADQQESPPALTPPVLAGVPIFPGAEVVDTAGTSDAARITVYIVARPDSVAAFYRRELSTLGWRISSEVPDSGGVDFYAERDGPPLWVQIRPALPYGTRMSLIGAVRIAPPAPDPVR